MLRLRDSLTQDICAATPALLLKTNDNKMLLFDLDRNTHGTTRQRKLDDMQLNVGKYKKSGRPKVGNEHYNLQWDAWVQPLVDALERLHGGSAARTAASCVPASHAPRAALPRTPQRLQCAG